MRQSTTTVRTFKAADGRKITAVKLAGNAGEARIRHDDFVRLQAQGFDGSWYFNHNTTKCNGYVRAQPLGGNNVTLSRLVAEAGSNEHVHHADGDNRNLKRENLTLHKGRWCSKHCNHHRSYQG